LAVVDAVIFEETGRCEATLFQRISEFEYGITYSAPIPL
jgi:hypothetical protein